jgi:hypothetical protein
MAFPRVAFAAAVSLRRDGFGNDPGLETAKYGKVAIRHVPATHPCNTGAADTTWVMEAAIPQEKMLDTFTSALETLLQLIMKFGDLIVAAIVAVELWLRAQLTVLGVPPAFQTVLLLALAIVLILAALRLFGGLIRVAVILILLLIGIHALMPVIHQ